MATDYDSLKTEIQTWLDSNNPNLVAAIPTFIEDAEKWIGRHLHTRDMECITTTPLTPNGVTEAQLGIYDLPADWGGHKSIRVDGDNLVLHYWAKIPPLSDSITTNWLLSKYPDLYRYGALMSAEAFLKNDPRIAVWAAKAGQILTEIEQHDEQDLYSGGPLKSRTQGERPWADQVNPGRLEPLPAYDFLDLVSSGITNFDCGYFTVTQSHLRIWPKPSMP